ncbi:MAG: SpoIIE family protein phosphatase, partial [Planctomycetota bacterium]
YEPEDVLGKTLYDFMLPSEAGRVRDLVEKNRAAGSSLVRLEHVNLHKNGTHVVLETNAAPVFDHGGTLSGYRGIDRDVTQIKQAYDLLQERERRYQQLFAAVTSYAYSVKVENGMSIATIHGEGCVSVTGYRPQDYQSTPDLWHLMIHPDDRDMVLRHVASVLGGQQVPPMEHRIFRRDGSIAWVRNTMIPHCNNGRLTHYDGLIEDITERKKAEEALQQKELELVTAQKIQKKLLPAAAPLLPGVDVFGAVYPAEFTAGDYFDYLTLPDGRVGFTIGDVTGHGFGPALIMASIHVMFRLLVETHRDVGEILELANSVLVNETQEDRFVTLVFACLDLETKTVVYSNAGHPPGYVLNAAGDVRARLVSTNLPLGVAPNAKFCTGDPVTLDPGDTVLLLSDGILESKSPEGVQFGPERTLDVVRANLHKTAAEIVENLCQAARGFSGGKAAFDDITAVAIKVESTH